MMPDITRPTIVLNSERVKQNIHRMAIKASEQEIRFRPHFKTHQSTAIGEYFKDAGVSAITVSSVEMAQYFALSGWKDITIAFPVNIRQIDSINALAQRIHLGLLVECIETANILSSKLTTPVDIWIEIDEGSHRSGIYWEQIDGILHLVSKISTSKNLTLKGLLTHPGRIYKAQSAHEIRQIYRETVHRMAIVRNSLAQQGYNLEVSVGDTPGCTLSENLGIVDEIRPGNFVFYDGMQFLMGVCKPKNIAALVACPVVAKYPERNEAVIYGGAVHLSKDTILLDDHIAYGLVAKVFGEHQNSDNLDWFKLVKGGYVARLTQEHGVVILPQKFLQKIEIGDLLFVIPAHVCLSVSAIGEYVTTDGLKFRAMIM